MGSSAPVESTTSAFALGLPEFILRISGFYKSGTLTAFPLKSYDIYILRNVRSTKYGGKNIPTVGIASSEDEFQIGLVFLHVWTEIVGEEFTCRGSLP